MDARVIEEILEKRLRRLFGKKISLSCGPVVSSKFSGIRPEIYLHAVRLEDHNGIMPDNAQIARRPVKGKSTYKGYVEERPGRLVLLVTCVTGSYKLLQEICKELTPAVLLGLELLPRIPLGAISDDSAQLHFDDFRSCLHTAEINRVTCDGISYFSGELEYHLNGFIHVLMTKRGGLAVPKKEKTKVTKKKRNKVQPKKP